MIKAFDFPYGRLNGADEPISESDSYDEDSQQTRDFHPMLVQYWPIVYDAGPALYQHWVNVSCLLGCIDADTEEYTTEFAHLPSLDACYAHTLQ